MGPPDQLTKQPESAILVGLGSNLGDREETLRSALERLSCRPGLRFWGASSIYETEPLGGPPALRYLNACATFWSRHGPQDVLALLLAIETEHGRVRSTPSAPRTLDLDLLICGDAIIADPRCTVPHPRMLERGFVLVPAAEVAPGMIHPGTGRTLREHRAALGPLSGIRLFRPAPWWTSEGSSCVDD